MVAQRGWHRERGWHRKRGEMRDWRGNVRVRLVVLRRWHGKGRGDLRVGQIREGGRKWLIRLVRVRRGKRIWSGEGFWRGHGWIHGVDLDNLKFGFTCNHRRSEHQRFQCVIGYCCCIYHVSEKCNRELIRGLR